MFPVGKLPQKVTSESFLGNSLEPLPVCFILVSQGQDRVWNSLNPSEGTRVVEPEDQQNDLNGQGNGNTGVQPEGNGNNGHPAWQEILEQLPEEFHSLITPKLQEWDNGVQEKLNTVRSQYDPYKPIVENNVPMERIQQALYVAQLIDSQPEQLVEQLVDHYKLDQFRPAADNSSNANGNTTSSNNNEDEFDMDDFDGVDVETLMKHPAFAELKNKQEELNQWYESQRQERERTEAQSKMEEYLTGLKSEHGEFDDLYVTTLMANGFDGTEAVKQYQDTIKNAAAALIESQQQGQNNNQPPPVIMGASGTTGSGVAEQNVDLGALGKGDLNDLVVQMIEQANQQ